MNWLHNIFGRILIYFASPSNCNDMFKGEPEIVFAPRKPQGEWRHFPVTVHEHDIIKEAATRNEPKFMDVVIEGKRYRIIRVSPWLKRLIKQKEKK